MKPETRQQWERDLAAIVARLRDCRHAATLASNNAYTGPHGTRMRKHHHWAQTYLQERELAKRTPELERLLRKADRLAKLLHLNEPATPPLHVVLVGCGASKREFACAARDLYTGCLFTDRRAFAERSGQPWFILSAKHGVLRPDTIVAPYDHRLPAWSCRTQIALHQWAKENVRRLREYTGAPTLHLEFHAGEDYVQPFRYWLRLREVSGKPTRLTLDHPVAGLGQGEQRAWYARQEVQHQLRTLAPLAEGFESL